MTNPAGEDQDGVIRPDFDRRIMLQVFVFNQLGDLERCALPHANVHSADGWMSVLKPVVARYQSKGERVASRADAAFATPAMYEFLEGQHRVRDSTSGLVTNASRMDSLRSNAAHLVYFSQQG